MLPRLLFSFNATASSDLYTLSLHDALPILLATARRDTEQLRLLHELGVCSYMCVPLIARGRTLGAVTLVRMRSEEHTSELQSLRHLVCRLLLEKKNRANWRAAQAHS